MVRPHLDVSGYPECNNSMIFTVLARYWTTKATDSARKTSKNTSKYLITNFYTIFKCLNDADVTIVFKTKEQESHPFSYQEKKTSLFIYSTTLI